ncbi:MAG: sulfite exporter TauE/SafE family protein [Candidatus Rokubacteria bacterium]|nr:sulfite exporter TauE/SafE family protein [Candidatus Rokubacteria bacterium]
MSLAWVAGALIIAAASFVMGLAGFGIALVALAFLPFLMEPATAVVLMTVYAIVFALAVFIPLRRDVTLPGVTDLLIGTLAGTPLGVWALATLPAGTLRRLIGLVLVGVVVLEWRGLYPARLSGRRWGLGAGLLAGVLGGAVGTPGPPVILYATTQGWGPRTMKANLQAFFVVNQAVILAGYWWAGLLTAEVGRLAAGFAVPAILGVAAGVRLFDRVDHVRFRQIVFALLGLSGLVLLARG